jgi:type I restriction enzyme R subunit
MTNFDFLKSEPRFSCFSGLAIEAERLYRRNTALCAVACRTALEAAVLWTYSADDELRIPDYETDPKLVELMSAPAFKKIVGSYILERIHYIRKIGNIGAHSTRRRVSEEEAALCLENLFVFLDFVAAMYSDVLANQERRYDPALRDGAQEAVDVSFAAINGVKLDVKKLLDENRQMRDYYANMRRSRQLSATKRLDLPELETRRRYIDLALEDAGWIKDNNWLNEYELEGLPTKSGTGRADYVLFDKQMKPLAVVEAKRTSESLEAGRQQASVYADAIERKTGRRPVVFLTNGFSWSIDDGVYPERSVSEVYSPRDLEKLFALRVSRRPLRDAKIDEEIAGRAYQIEAVRRTCEAFEEERRRKVLLTMATGSGKTRTAMAICKILTQQYWAKHILFLADRNALVTQAKRSFGNAFENMTVTNLCEDKSDYNARFVFSTYQTMMSCIDDAADEEGRLFTPGHFDLVICDEAHRSIYNKFQAIFDYFDAPLLGLTATPKDEVDKNTFEIFELANGSPTYDYNLAEAVADGYLVNYKTVETKLKFLEKGIVYDDLSDEEKEIYEETFADEYGELPERIAPGGINEWLFNEDTIVQALNVLMERGLRVHDGANLGKTIIFAKNHSHAEKILDVFNKQYPTMTGYARVIDNYDKFSQKSIDDFSNPEKLAPQIAISVDMLDTGIDVPEILNLVFFKKVMSKAKFWQMIGRGTRLCPELIDGADKEFFYIFDFCGNFEFFSVKGEGTRGQNSLSLQSQLFALKAEIAYKLQKAEYQTPELIEFRKALVDELLQKVRALNKQNFAVRQQLSLVEAYSREEAYEALTYADVKTIRNELARLVEPEFDGDPKAFRFDALVYGVEAASLAGRQNRAALKEIRSKASALTRHENIPAVHAQSALLGKIAHTDYLVHCTFDDFEQIRIRLRDLIKYLPKEQARFDVNFADEILSIETRDSELGGFSLEGYKERAERYLKEHKKTNPVVAKLYGNIPLSPEDVVELERLLWNELGSKEDYDKEIGDKPLGKFVREVVGLDQNAAQEAFAQFLNDSNLNSGQIHFVNTIVKHIVANGMIEDLSILMESPFSDYGSISELFDDNLSAIRGIRDVLTQIKRNAHSA